MGSTSWQKGLGDRIRNAREAKGWNRNDLTTEAHMAFGHRAPSSDRIGYLERGEYKLLDLEAVEMLARVLDTSAPDLIEDAISGIDLAEGDETVRYLWPAAETGGLAAAA